jgi:hypothetical protein
MTEFIKTRAIQQYDMGLAFGGMQFKFQLGNQLSVLGF